MRDAGVRAGRLCPGLARLKEASDRYRVLGDVASLMDATGDAGYMTALSGDAVGRRSSLPSRSLWRWTSRHATASVGHFSALATWLPQREMARAAVRLFAAAAAIQQSMQEDLRPSVDVIQERILTEQRQRLGESDYLAAWEEGCSLSQERAVAEARAVLSAVTSSDG